MLTCSAWQNYKDFYVKASSCWAGQKIAVHLNSTATRPSSKLTFDSNRPFSYSKKESGSSDISLHFVEFSNVHNTDKSSNATQSNLVYKTV